MVRGNKGYNGVRQVCRAQSPQTNAIELNRLNSRSEALNFLTCQELSMPVSDTYVQEGSEGGCSYLGGISISAMSHHEKKRKYPKKI